ncbi:Phospholipase A and acyltransferase 2 [Bulinus truncatus]|nr:Phospholipase A and acyltransferase 2 [Bulinus truncatus]
MCIDSIYVKQENKSSELYQVDVTPAEHTFPWKAKSHMKHNKRVNEDVREGDLLRITRNKHHHWAICISGNEVIHMVGFNKADCISELSNHLFEIGGVKYNRAKVVADDFWNVVGSDKVQIKNKDDKARPLHVQQILQNATGKLGEVNYGSVYSNCKDFVHWCRYENREDRHTEDMTRHSFTEGDILEFHFDKISSYGVFVGNDMIVHPVADQFSNQLIICIDELCDVPGEPQVCNHLDLQKHPQSLDEILDAALLDIGNRTKLDSLQFASLCRYGTAEEKLSLRFILFTSVALGTVLITQLGIFQEMSSSLQKHVYQICESAVLCCISKVLRKIRSLCFEKRSVSSATESSLDMNLKTENEMLKKTASQQIKENGRLSNGGVKQLKEVLI